MNEYSLSQLASQFFSQNYDYLWLKTMLETARTIKNDPQIVALKFSEACQKVAHLIVGTPVVAWGSPVQ